MRRLLLCTALACPLSANAQEGGLLDAIHPDRILTQVLQTLIGAARTQSRITYGDLSLSLAEGRLSLADVAITLPPARPGRPNCDIALKSLDLTSDDPLSLIQFSGRIDMRDVQASDGCLNLLDMAPLAPMLPGDGIRVPEMTLDYAYDAPSSGLDLRMVAQVDGIAALSIGAEFAYFWFKETGGSEPEIDADLSRVTVALDNLGGFELARGFLPPPMTNPDTAAAFVVQSLTPILDSMGGGQPMPKSAKTFVVSLGESWSGFVTDPNRLVIETGFDPAMPRAIDADFLRALDAGPLPLIDLLEPQIGATSAAERDVLDPALVARGLDAPEDLSPAEARVVGLAHLRGDRAPLNLAQARLLLRRLVEAGDADVALELAEAAGTGEAAYEMALAAGPGDAPRLRPLLDRLEADLPFATRLRLQDGANPSVDADDLAGPTAELRTRAEAHLRGVGAPRSLRQALLYASIAAAEGDSDALILLTRIDRAIPAEGRSTWDDLRADVATQATTAWLSRQDG